MLADALNMALDDEYRARATYQSVLNQFGPVFPFVNIVQSEQRHITALLPLFQRYGLAPVPDRWSGQAFPFNSVVEACEAGIAAEISNYQMYDRFLEQIAEPDVRFVFSNLRNASAYHHLPAFRYCAGQGDNTIDIPPPITMDGGDKSTIPWAAVAGVIAGTALVWWWIRRPQIPDA